jgi:hypothetical protein
MGKSVKSLVCSGNEGHHRLVHFTGYEVQSSPDLGNAGFKKSSLKKGKKSTSVV